MGLPSEIHRNRAHSINNVRSYENKPIFDVYYYDASIFKKLQGHRMKVLVLGASGMLGNAMLRIFAEAPGFHIFGTVRSREKLKYLPQEIAKSIISGLDVERQSDLIEILSQIRPEIVINCIGLVKQLESANDPLVALPINSIFPHQLARICHLANARLVHISTDCVFSGKIGGYREDDICDATDLYGLSKLLGELYYPNTITLRTSIIGHEVQGNHSLINWFLSQNFKCKGFTRAIFSGLPTVELAQIIRDVVVPRPELTGLYHLAASAISKYDLLKMVAKKYGKQIEIVADDEIVINRSLNANRFFEATGYVAPEWNELISKMHSYYS